MKNGIFTLDLYSFVKGLAVAVVTAIVVSIFKVVQSVGFDIFTADWVMILKSAANFGFGAGIGYVVTNFISTDKGSVLALTPEATPPQSD